MSGRSIYEYMGNKKWLSAAEQEKAGQAVIPGCEAKLPLHLDERYTLRETLEWSKAVAVVDAFDLDAAACAEAHVAPRWYGIEDDGLQKPWGPAGWVWCNPPYSDCGAWVRKAWLEWEQDYLKGIAMLLPATRTEQGWWDEHVEDHCDGRGSGVLSTHFLPGRQRFGIPGNPLGVGVGSPPFGVVLLVWRKPGPVLVKPKPRLPIIDALPGESDDDAIERAAR